MDSKLQIISGLYRGRKLRLPPDARPTQNRARVALFNMLGAVVGTDGEFVVWDAFAGSGAFGIECLSRYLGARVYFTDVSPASVRTVRDNLANLAVGARATVTQINAFDAVGNIAPKSDVVFVDPPYAAKIGPKFIDAISPYVRCGTTIIWEQDAQDMVMPDPNIWDTVRMRQYGRAVFFILQRRD